MLRVGERPGTKGKVMMLRPSRVVRRHAASSCHQARTSLRQVSRQCFIAPTANALSERQHWTRPASTQAHRLWPVETVMASATSSSALSLAEVCRLHVMPANVQHEALLRGWTACGKILNEEISHSNVLIDGICTAGEDVGLCRLRGYLACGGFEAPAGRISASCLPALSSATSACLLVHTTTIRKPSQCG